VPLYANFRETWANIELISATIILYMKNLIPNFRVVYTAVKAFAIAARETKFGERIPLTTKSISNALRLMNKCMGDNVIEAWIQQVYHLLQCKTNPGRL
jgi:uncharacterized protein YneF (UPF0154 family)